MLRRCNATWKRGHFQRFPFFRQDLHEKWKFKQESGESSFTVNCACITCTENTYPWLQWRLWNSLSKLCLILQLYWWCYTMMCVLYVAWRRRNLPHCTALMLSQLTCVLQFENTQGSFILELTKLKKGLNKKLKWKKKVGQRQFPFLIS